MSSSISFVRIIQNLLAFREERARHDHDARVSKELHKSYEPADDDVLVVRVHRAL